MVLWGKNTAVAVRKPLPTTLPVAATTTALAVKLALQQRPPLLLLRRRQQQEFLLYSHPRPLQQPRRQQDVLLPTLYPLLICCTHSLRTMRLPLSLKQPQQRQHSSILPLFRLPSTTIPPRPLHRSGCRLPPPILFRRFKPPPTFTITNRWFRWPLLLSIILLLLLNRRCLLERRSTRLLRRSSARRRSNNSSITP